MKCEIKPGFKTDHSSVILKINLSEQKRGPGYFKINNSIIYDNEYQCQIKNAVAEIVRLNQNSNANTLWELIKGTIRNVSIKYATHLRKKNENKEKELTEEINRLQSLDTDDNTIFERINNLKEELDAMLTEKVNGMIHRSKAQHVEYNEKNSKYFANLEKRHNERKTILKLKTQGKEITNIKEIIHEQREFYKNLYERKTQTESDIDFF